MSPAVWSYSAAGQLDQGSFYYSCNGVAWISFKVVILKFINYFMLLKKYKRKKKEKNKQQFCKLFGYYLHPCLAKICSQGEDADLRQGGCWFGLAHCAG